LMKTVGKNRTAVYVKMAIFLLDVNSFSIRMEKNAQT
jgi:hypothetical protein